MLAGVLTELNKQATMPCYFGDQSKEQIGDNLIKAVARVVKHLEEPVSKKFLAGSYLTYVDFMLFEVCERG